MIRRWITNATIGLGGLAVVAGLGLAATPAASAAPVTPAVHTVIAAPAAAPPCAAGYTPMTNQAGFAVTGNGVNAPVTLSATGNCFKPMDANSCGVNCTSYCYQNGDGHALWDNAGTMELGGACHASGHPNEQLTGTGFISGEGWALGSIGDNFQLMQPVVCGEGGSHITTPTSVGSCPRWTVT